MGSSPAGGSKSTVSRQNSLEMSMCKGKLGNIREQSKTFSCSINCVDLIH